MAPTSAAVAPSPPRERRVKVGVRLRPFTDNEKVRAGGKAAWTWHESTIYQQIFPAQIPPRRLPGSSTSSRAGGERRAGSSTSSASSTLRDAAAFPSSYALDRLFPPAARTRQVYEETVKSFKDGVMAAMDGYHSSVFVYGQTGTGKTYTMQGTRADPGVIPLAVQDIFQQVAARGRDTEFVLRFSYFEIYNERFFDLLAAGAKADVKMYDVTSRGSGHGSSGGTSNTSSGNGGVKDVVLKGLREELVVSPEHVLSLVEVGNLHRHMATTDANDQSSRSHVIFRMIIESQSKRAPLSGNQHQSQPPIRLATLNLIDLAGSESVRLANTAGQHLDEGKYINRSLLTLGHIIWKLSRRARSSSTGHKTTPAPNRLAHLPFRNSKLTRLLQPALSGHTHVAVICTAAPSVECLMETHGTLKFATRARRVTTRATVNELSPSSSSDNGSVLRKYRARLRELQDQLEALERRRSGGGRSGPPSASADERRVELQFAVRNLERSILNAGPPPVTEPAPARSMPHLRTVAEDREVESTPPRVLRSARPTLAAARSSGSDSLGNSNKTLVGSGGSGSTKTLPLSSSSSRGLADLGDDDGETKGDDQDQDEPEHEEVVAERPSLTAVLMDKYAAELARLESAEVDARERERLREFVRGLEIAQAEQETRMSKIRELEVENRRLRELVGSQPSTV